MEKRTRLFLLGLSFVILIIVGYLINDSFDFMLNQFWFTSGLLLLILLSLIDQPHFSKDANVFVNSVTAWMSLLLIPINERSWVWIIFFSITIYLIISSYLIIWLRKKELQAENELMKFASRLNRQIGRPESIFSSFFIWGAVRQFGLDSPKFDALLLFWIVFMILNLPGLAEVLNKLFIKNDTTRQDDRGTIKKIIEPKIIQVNLPNNYLYGIGSKFFIKNKNAVLADAVLIDERIISGNKVGKLVATTIYDNWKDIVEKEENNIFIEQNALGNTDSAVISVVGKGSSIPILYFEINPKVEIREGEVVWVETSDNQKVFYQVVSAKIVEETTDEGNLIQYINVEAAQLGLWNDTKKEFYPFDWVPPSGQLVQKAREIEIDLTNLTNEYSVVGKVPNSNFPVHVNLEDIVTHNTAIIGVTGSGKSYLSFHLIEALVEKGIRVLILDISREHIKYLNHLTPFQLKQVADVATWVNDPTSSLIGIHQYATSNSFPSTTADFVQAAFNIISQTPLQVGRNLPAKLCVLFEEAHSLIPEWNQVAQQSDTQCVNKTARIILQGRKFGLGSIIVSQRTANVTKTILNQCNTIFALQSFDQTGLDFLENYMGEGYSRTISSLPQYHSILVGKASSSKKPIIFKINDLTNRWKEPEKTDNNPIIVTDDNNRD